MTTLVYQNKTPEKKRPEINSELSYRGRFAPSPSGFLHFGSLIAALASFLDAKAHIDKNNNQGKWLVRIEDIDPPREQVGASTAILTTLEAFGLHWDEDVLYQSQQSELYRHLLNDLSQKNLSYYCQCTRAEIKAQGGIYQGHCRTLNLAQNNFSAKSSLQQKSAIRLLNQHGLYQFDDIFQKGKQGQIQCQIQCQKRLAEEDFIIHRKDGLFAYQLAVVHDDIYQGITHVIRGCDLLEPTARQLTLFATLNKKAPQYGHVPLAITADGYKLSKQNKAAAINNNNPQPALISALRFLGQQPPKCLQQASVEEIITWGINHWSRSNVPNQKELRL